MKGLARAMLKVLRIMDELCEDDRAALARQVQATYGRPLTPQERKERWRSSKGNAAVPHQGNGNVPAKGNAAVPASPSSSPVVSEVVRSEHTETTEETSRKDQQEPDGFTRFWRAYPKRIGKGKARQSWIKNRCESRTNLILTALHYQRDFLQRDGGQFIPNPATWLNERRWEDDPPQPIRPGDERTQRNVAGISEWLRQQQEAP